MLTPGTRLGQYLIRGPLGAGGMGEVYRAHDAKLDRDVAIKVLPGGIAADPDHLARFQQEARAASALNHPNILHIYDVGQEGETVYLVMELVEGRTLRDLLRDGPLPLRKLLEIGEQAASGLAKAHAAGIVHRDLKPENLMLTGDGVVKILDFGLAKLLPSAAGSGSQTPTAVAPATGSGMVLGTAAYMSPEQARGQPVDFLSDQFSLGTVLYELASGERPFQGDSFVQTLSAIIEQDPEPLIRRNPRVPAPLQWMVARCMAKEPEGRYASTLDLVRDLRSLRENLSSLAAPTAGPMPAPRRGRLAYLLTAAAGALLGAAFVALLGGVMRVAPVPAELRPLTFSGKDGSPDASPDGRTLAFMSMRDGRSRIWLKQLTDGSEVALTEGVDSRPRFSPDGTAVLFAHNAEDRFDLYRVAAVGGKPRRVVRDAFDGDWAPDGRHIVFLRYVERDGAVACDVGLASLDRGDEEIVATVENRAMVGPRFSPDGRWIAVSSSVFGIAESSGRNLLLIRADGSAQRWLDPPVEGGDVSAVAWLGPEEVLYTHGESATSVSLGSTLVSAGASRMFLQNIESGAARVLLWTPNLSTAVDVLAPGELVFDAVSARQNLLEFDLAAGPDAAPRRVSSGASLDRQPVYSPDGSLVVYSSNRSGNLDIWAHDRRQGTFHRLTDHPADDWDPAFTPDGKSLIMSSRRGGNFEIWMASADGSGARMVTRDGVDAENPTSTPDGQWLAYNSGNPRSMGVWKIRSDGSEATRLVAGAIQWPELSPDGRHVAFSTVRRQGLTVIRVVRMEDGELLPFEIELPGREGANGRSRWLRDGSGIAFTWHEHGGRPGVYAQDFDPTGRDTTATRRPLVVFADDVLAESFGLSPDGKRITVSASVRNWSLMQAANVPGL